MEWTDDKVNKLIELYEQNMCLYDVVSSGYHNRNRKKDAVERMACELETTGL